MASLTKGNGMIRMGKTSNETILGMRRILITLMFTFLPIIASAQGAGGQVRRPVKKQETTNTTPAKKRQNPKKESEQKPEKKQQENKPVEQKPVEAAGYDVTFSCNVPSATLYIDGNSYGTANGTRFLKAGSHTARLNADGYEPLSQSIQVNSSNFVLKKKENQLSPVIQNLLNNMVRVEGGTFTMGATSEQGSDADSDEKPTHQVTLSSFSIGKYEVTQEEWQAVMGDNPSNFKGAKHPVEEVSWNDCQEFIRKLNAITGKHFRLPTEAEWEYAARGGNRCIGYKYSGSDNLDRVAWYDSNSGNTTHDIGQKSPNEIGLFDMSGNVREWCADWYGSYKSNSQSNPGGPSSGSYRVFRGGSWFNVARRCRVSDRHDLTPGDSDFNLGLRLAL